jgi:hypothetical protein
LTDRLSSEPWQWASCQHQAFQELEAALTSAPFLAFLAKYFATQPKLSLPQVHWSELLAEFDMTITPKPGKDEIVPDVLSRRTDHKLHLFSSLADVALTSDLIARIRRAYPGHPTARLLVRTSSHAIPDYCTNSSLLCHIKNERFILQDILAHHYEHSCAGHSDMEHTHEQQPGQLHFGWPGLYEDVVANVRSCHHRQLHKPSVQPKLLKSTFNIPSQPFE